MFDLEKMRSWLQIMIPAAALGAAVLIATWQQARIDRRVVDERSRKHLASRTVLPISLANLSQYSENCLGVLLADYPFSSEVTYFGSKPELPSLPEDVIKSLKECVETADTHIATALAHLIQFSQVQHSRMIGQFRKTSFPIEISKHSFDQMLFDIARLWLIIENFYEYGRLKANRVETRLTEEDMLRAARVLDLERLGSFMDYVRMRKNSIQE